MQFIQGQDLPLTLQLIKGDNTYEDEATVTYEIYSNDLTTLAVSAQTAAWNDTHYCYYDLLDVSTNWASQSPGNYVLRWSISNTDYFPSVMVEDMCVLTDASSGSGLTAAQEAKIDAIQADLDDVTQYQADLSSLATSAQLVDIQTDITKLLGLNHENIYMDQPQYDSDDNLVSLRIRIYSSSLSVGTENDIIATYRVTADGDGSGRFEYWKQILLI